MIWTPVRQLRQHLSIEMFESKFPALITEYGYRQDSAGPGKWRGGNGIVREYRMTTDTEMSLWFERSGNPAWASFGGQDGAPPEAIINPGTPRETRRLQTNRMPLRQGDTVRCYTGGGGGYGNPADRDPQAVQADLTDGHISPDYAQRHHGLEGEDPKEDRTRSLFGRIYVAKFNVASSRQPTGEPRAKGTAGEGKEKGPRAFRGPAAAALRLHSTLAY